jgi:regulatory protein
VASDAATTQQIANPTAIARVTCGLKPIWAEQRPTTPMQNRRPASTARTTGPRPVTPAYLRNAAMHYLSGRSASVAMLQQTLDRRAKRRLAVRTLEPEICTLIETTIAELLKLGLLNDAKFAENRAASLTRKGFSKSRIGLGLKQKGITGATLEAAISPDHNDLVQARLFAQRKRLGHWRRGDTAPEKRDKDLRALARAGFSYAISAKALAEPDPDAS